MMTSEYPQLVAIFGPARSRTSYLRSLLHSHPDITCHSELFHHLRPIILLEELANDTQLYDLSWRDQNPHDYIERLLKKTQYYRPQSMMMGCKMLLYPYQMNRGMDAILDFKPKVILLRRDDKLAWYSSMKIAIETKQWFLNVNDKPNATQHKIHFNQAEFDEMLETTQLCERMALREIKARNLSYLEIECDDLMQPATIKNILAFLDLPEFELSSITQTQNTPSILDRFSNIDEVPAWLKQDLRRAG